MSETAVLVRAERRESPRCREPGRSADSIELPVPDAACDGVGLRLLSRASGRFEPVWTIEIQTLPSDVDRILDAIVDVHPLRYGTYERNASVSAPGLETARPPAGSTTATNVDGFEPGSTETFPVVELKVSIERDLDTLEAVMNAILGAHHYEEPVIFLREDWVSRAAYDPNSDNPNRWWNNGRGLPDRIPDITAHLDRQRVR